MTSIDHLMEKAATKTGLDDFGADDFRSGLAVLVDALNSEARLNSIGEHVVFGKIVKLLMHRLHIEEWFTRHPEIEDEVLQPAIIGVGLPRTGSTALSNLLNQDPDTRSLPAYLAMNPCPPPSTVLVPDPRIADAQQTINLQLQVSPQLASMVPTSADGPAECLELMALDFKSHIFGALAQIPSYEHWLIYEADLRSTYRYERRVLKYFQWRLPSQPWVLKAPSHLVHIDALAEVFDDAKFVCTHRDPVKIMPSCNGLYEATISMFTDHLDRKFIGQQNLEKWSAGMDRLMSVRDQGQEHRCFDIGHRQLQREPVETVERFYDWLRRPVAPAFRAGMQRWWRVNAADRQSASYASLEEFGLTAGEVRTAFRGYINRFTDAGVLERSV